MSLLERLKGTKDPEPSSAQIDPISSPGHDDPSLIEGSEAQSRNGVTTSLKWAARTDVGQVREHNEDSFLALAPTFAVSDGMGGHAAGEVASAIAVSVISQNAPAHADDLLLGAAVEKANAAVIEAAATGRGKPGMGCTASAVSIEQNKMAVAHVGDSRVYLLHGGALVRLTHDHSYVEELVDAGEITADEARVHPSRSVITRALGSDPDMYADHFTIDVNVGDRVLLCSDGLSSMIEDSLIEAIAVSSATPQACVDNLVAAALSEGGYDNVTVVVIDVTDDGVIDQHRRRRIKLYAGIGVILLGVCAALFVVVSLVVRNSWYVGTNGDVVAIYRGVNASVLGHDFYSLAQSTDVRLDDLPDALRTNLRDGVLVSSEQEAYNTVRSYQEQIESDRERAKQVADKTSAGTETTQDNPAVPVAPEEAEEKAAEKSEAKKNSKSEADADANSENADTTDDDAEGGE